MANHDKRPDAEARGGIFWLNDGGLITDSTPLSQVEPYGDVLTHATGHIDHRTALPERGAIPIDVKYEEPPRGTVAFCVIKGTVAVSSCRSQ